MRSSAPFFVVAALALGVLAAFSCKTFDLPTETCDPSHFHGGMLSGGLTDSACNRCLEDQCCEQVGICARTDGCADAVSGIHKCVLDAGLAGAKEEMGCADMHRLVPKSPADEAYRCMRSGCGNECGLPVCKVDQAAVLIQTPECDACFSSSCCSELNACYKSRACKLTVECIIKSCGTMLGDSLAGAPLTILANLDAGALDICGDSGPPRGMDVPKCVTECVCDFMNNDQGLMPAEDAQKPAMLSLHVYACGQQAGCGTACPKSSPTADAGAGADAGAH